MRRLIILFLFLNVRLCAQDLFIEGPVNFLALGDSYTIGQGVATDERWPEQLALRLRENGEEVSVEIIAATGWTTGSLISALNTNPPEGTYSLVSLLIGVNNQFQRRSPEEFEEEFEALLNKALSYAGGNQNHVFVLSIPDYSYTPFGESYPNASQEISLFNVISKEITLQKGIPYINITDISRLGTTDPELIASDGLHPSGKMYALWVDRILNFASPPPLVTGTDELPDRTFRIYPNPVIGSMTVKHEGKGEIRIYNSLGQEIHQDQSMGQSLVNTREWPHGVYTIVFYNATTQTRSTFIKL